MNEKVALITGGARGIGFGIALAFARSHYRLVLTGRTKETLEIAKKQLADLTEVLIIVADGSKEQDVIDTVEETIKQYGRIDVLVNNAQVSKSGLTLVEHTKEDFDLAVNSGLYATFYYMKNAYPYLKKTHGSVINFASGAGIEGLAGQASYAASKEGIRGLSRVAATEWGVDQIRVNVLCPLVETPGLAAWKQDYPDLYEKTIQKIPLGRFGDAETDVGRVCVFLASDDASYLTGQTISLQGGSGLRP